MDVSREATIPGALQAERVPFVTTKTPSPYSMQASIPSLAARKAALFEKFGGKTTTSPAVSAKHLPTPSFSQPDWTKSLTGDGSPRERKDTLASNYSISTKLSPMPTGSTVASTAVDHPAIAATTPEPHRQVPSFASVGNRVRLAVMTLNAMEKSRDGSVTWRVGATGEERSASSLDRRSWSRLSGATRVGDAEAMTSGEAFKTFAVDETLFAESVPSLSDSPNATLNTLNTSGIFDETFDTHPPDMVSPRTGLAYVILPPWARRQSAIEEEDALPTPSREEFPLKPESVSEAVPELDEDALQSRSSTPEPPSDIEHQDLASSSPPSSPSRSPAASPLPPAPVRHSEPLVLMGQGKPSSAAPTSHTRSVSVNQSPRVRERVRCSSTLPPRQPINPTQFWKVPERLRRPSSVLPPIPQEPLLVKAQNKHPLRKVQTGAPKLMRFSMII